MTSPVSPDPNVLEVIEDEVDWSGSGDPDQKRWRILIVDDDPEVHAATRFALGHTSIAGRSLELLSAHSAAEGKLVLDQNPDIAVVLLDVVMEEHDSGLKYVEWMRAQGYDKQRIILRTGQPGYAPEIDVIRDYDINDYRTKSELTQARLITSMTTAIRTFEQFWIVEGQREELENFAYALAHDFKQTTRQISTFSELVTKSFKLTDDPDAAKALAYLDGAARRLSALVDVMSQYTLLGRVADLRSVDLETVFAQVREASLPVLNSSNGELVAVGTGMCHGNGTLIAQVLQILIANGLQHNDSATPRVEISASINAGRCIISICDNGVGVDPEYIEAIFKPRMRLRATRDLPNTGLGLTLSRRAIESQGGNIVCESSTGAGSLFRLMLPVHARPATLRSASVRAS